MLIRENISACSENSQNDKKGIVRTESRTFRRYQKIAKSYCELRYACLSVRPRGTTRLPLVGFSLNLILQYY
jgi:hypothetical protein